ncbi:hypothetical protein HanHA89_Chr11g0439541 [Helianthus annuus]|nr:hypothetical protein HanHA89_Chr11g0439541 [Helianthus annuus]
MFCIIIFFFFTFRVIRRFFRSQRLVNLRFGFSVKFESRSDTSSSVWFMLGSLGSEFRVQHQALEWVNVSQQVQLTRSNPSQLGQHSQTESTELTRSVQLSGSTFRRNDLVKINDTIALLFL